MFPFNKTQLSDYIKFISMATNSTALSYNETIDKFSFYHILARLLTDTLGGTAFMLTCEEYPNNSPFQLQEFVPDFDSEREPVIRAMGKWTISYGDLKNCRGVIENPVIRGTSFALSEVMFEEIPSEGGGPPHQRRSLNPQRVHGHAPNYKLPEGVAIRVTSTILNFIEAFNNALSKTIEPEPAKQVLPDTIYYLYNSHELNLTAVKVLSVFQPIFEGESGRPLDCAVIYLNGEKASKTQKFSSAHLYTLNELMEKPRSRQDDSRIHEADLGDFLNGVKLSALKFIEYKKNTR